MLSNRRQNAVYRNTVVSAKAPLASVDICDVDISGDGGDDDDKNDNHINNNNNGLSTTTATTTVVKEQWPDKPNASEQNVQDQTESDVLLSSSSPSTNGYRRPRPSTINLQPIAGAVKVNDNDTTDGCFSGTSEDSEQSASDQGINIQFCDIIYRARREIAWDRCKYTHFSREKNKKRQ